MRRRRVGNAEIGRALREMALFLEMEGVPFKPRAYEKAALAVEALERPLADLAAEAGMRGIRSVPGVGEGIGRKIEDLLLRYGLSQTVCGSLNKVSRLSDINGLLTGDDEINCDPHRAINLHAYGRSFPPGKASRFNLQIVLARR